MDIKYGEGLFQSILKVLKKTFYHKTIRITDVCQYIVFPPFEI